MLGRRTTGVRRFTVTTLCRRRYSQEVTINEYFQQFEDENKSKREHGTAANGIQFKSIEEVGRGVRSRHLIRAILRECTYLPDQFARQWMSSYALTRFRTYSFKAWEHRNDEAFNDRLRRKEKEARQSLGALRRANEGDRKCLLKVLFMTYGRIGKRRHELMRPLLPVREQQHYMTEESDAEEVLVGSHKESDGPGLEVKDDNLEADHAIDQKHKTHPRESHKLDLTPPLRALLISQMKAAPPAILGRNPRRLNPEIPELNSWHRPMPQKRIKNMKQKHYAQLLDQVLPPLPEDEWNRLRDLADGTVPIEAAVPRRKPPGEVAERPTSGSALEMVVMYGKVPKKVFGSYDGHTITPRFMRRLYALVFSQCPLMDLDATSETWRVVWGGKANHLPRDNTVEARTMTEPAQSI